MKHIVAIGLLLTLSMVVEAKNTPTKVVAVGNTVLEAEDYNKRNMRKNHKWDKVRGKRADIPTHMHALPADNTVFDINHRDFEKKTPILEYKLDFAEAGTYYVWINGQGEPGGASIAIGLDDAMIKSVAVGWFPYEFAWIGNYFDKSRISLEINEPGEHLFQVWMLEDGMRVDKYLFTTDANFTP